MEKTKTTHGFSGYQVSKILTMISTLLETSQEDKWNRFAQFANHIISNNVIQIAPHFSMEASLDALLEKHLLPRLESEEQKEQFKAILEAYSLKSMKTHSFRFDHDGNVALLVNKDPDHKHPDSLFYAGKIQTLDQRILDIKFDNNNKIALLVQPKNHDRKKTVLYDRKEIGAEYETVKAFDFDRSGQLAILATNEGKDFIRYKIMHKNPVVTEAGDEKIHSFLLDGAGNIAMITEREGRKVLIYRGKEFSIDSGEDLARFRMNSYGNIAAETISEVDTLKTPKGTGIRRTIYYNKDWRSRKDNETSEYKPPKVLQDSYEDFNELCPKNFFSFFDFEIDKRGNLVVAASDQFNTPFVRVNGQEIKTDYRRIRLLGRDNNGNPVLLGIRKGESFPSIGLAKNYYGTNVKTYIQNFLEFEGINDRRTNDLLAGLKKKEIHISYAGLEGNTAPPELRREMDKFSRTLSKDAHELYNQLRKEAKYASLVKSVVVRGLEQ